MLRGFGDVSHAVDRIRRSGALVAARGGGWVTARHDVAVVALAHPQLAPLDSDQPYVPERPLPLPAALVHAQVPSASWAGIAQAIAPEVTADLPTEVDLVPAVARRVPGAVVAEALGMAESELCPLAEATGPLLDAVHCPQTLASTTTMLEAVAALDRRLRDPGRVLLATVGVHLATTLLGNALNRLLDHPLEPIGQVVAETLRHDPPVALYALVARADLELGARTVRAGEQVVLLLGAAGTPETGAPFDRLMPMACAVAAAALTAVAGRTAGALRTGPGVRAVRAPVTRRLVSLPVRLVPREEKA